MKKFSDIAEKFYNNEHNRGHADRRAVQHPIEEINAALAGGKCLAQQIITLTSKKGLKVLDVGCSWGAFSFNIASSQLVSEVFGLDVESEALELGEAIKEGNLIASCITQKVKFVNSTAEKMPFQDNCFDIIICNTVIEHVENVENALLEMYRVLKPEGFIYLEAPNYMWPYEPHLNLWMLPLGPKWMAKILAKVMRKEQADFVDHLNFISPFSIEKIFNRHSIYHENIYLEKLRKILINCEYQNIVGWKKAIPFLKLLHTLKLSKLVYRVVSKLGIYTSIRYKICK